MAITQGGAIAYGNNVVTGGGSGGGSGHTILNDAGTPLAQEDDLQFVGTYVSDDSTNNKTVVPIIRSMQQAEFDQLSSDEKKGLIDVTDAGYTPGSNTRILDLSDVAVVMPVNGQILKYDSTTNKWVNASEVSVPEIVDNLTTDDATKTLSAAQGKALKDITDTISGNIPQIVNDVTTGGTTKALSAEQGKNLNTAVSGKVAKAGDTATGPIRSTFQSSTWINSVTNSAFAIDHNGYGGWICGPVKTGRVTISTYPSSNDNVYMGYAETGKTENSFTRQIYWDASTGKINGTITNSDALNGYSSDTNATANTVVRRDANGYIRCTYCNSSAGEENINSYSGARPAFFSTDGWLRKTSIANMKTALGISSQRFKHNIQDMTEERAKKILEIKPITFDWNDEEFVTTQLEDNAGFIAEDIFKVIPDLVTFEETKDGERIVRGIEYERFTPYLIKMIQMQQKEIDELKKLIGGK